MGFGGFGGLGPDNSFFDDTFFFYELLGIGLWFVLALCFLWPRRYLWPLGIGLALGTQVVLPAIWLFGYPPGNPYEGVWRLIFGGICLVINGLLSCVWAIIFSIRLKRTIRRPLALFLALSVSASPAVILFGYWAVSFVYILFLSR